MHCIIQARCGSKRLNRKIFRKINKLSIIDRVIKRIKKSKKITNIIIATSSLKIDDDVENYCIKNKIICFRGDLNNVASRFFEISKIYKITEMIRVSCDSPFINYKLIDQGITMFKKSNFDIVTNVFPRTYPKGLSYEIFKSSIIQKNITKYSKKDKEHVTTYFYKNYKKFNIFNFEAKKNNSNINLCVDTYRDLNFLRKNFYKVSKWSFK